MSLSHASFDIDKHLRILDSTGVINSELEGFGAQSQTKFHLTFDVDWAPDFAIDEILVMLRAKKTKATFFITHSSDIVQDILSDGHEVGLHPNFLPSSSQGQTVEAVMDYLLNIYPEATSIRMHSLFQSTPLLHRVFSTYTQLKIDLSLLTYRLPSVARSQWNFEDLSFSRINYNWEDDLAFYDNEFAWDKMEFFSNSIIFDFHPIHIALNSRNNSSYMKLKQDLAGEPLFSISKNRLLEFRNESKGASDYLQSILDSTGQAVSLKELT